MPQENAANGAIRGRGSSKDVVDFDIDYKKEAMKKAKALDIALGLEKEFYAAVEKLAKDSNLRQLENEIKSGRLTEEELLRKTEEYNRKKEDIANKAMDAINLYSENLMKKGNAAQRAEVAKNAAENIKKASEAAEEEFRIKTASMRKESTEYKELQKDRIKEVERFSEASSKIEETQRKLSNAEAVKSFKLMGDGINDIVEGNFKGGIGKVLAGVGSFSIKDIAKNLTDQAKNSKEELARKEEEYEELLELDPEKAKEKEEELSEFRKQVQKDEALAFGAAAAEAVVDKIGADYKAAFGEAERFLTESASHMNARLQGTEDNFKTITDLVTSNLSISPYVQTQKVLEQIREASDQGIAYNLEQRAFLSEISDKIANTFDAFDSNLTRLIRLQQADSTAARLGMEATLTKLFNSMFEDTSYLGSSGGGGLADQVAAAILDAESQLGRNAAAEFEYTIQKWLGSLSSLGMSKTAITNIAQGLNYLATGDVTSLSSNSSLQTLFAMSANRANLSYADLLTGGLNASNTNRLLEAMVEYLKEIAENADNQVVKGAYGSIFNLSLSDLKAISNITESEISTLAGNNLSYTSMNSELRNQFIQLPMRMSMPEFLGNIYNNAMYGLASDMANNPVTYAMTKMLNFAETLGTDINIPFINAAGFGLDLNTTVLGLVKTASNIATIMGLAGTVLNGLQSIGAGFGLNLDAWGGTETTQRGGVGNLLSSIIGGLSGSEVSYRTNYNQQDTTSQSLAQATEDANETKKTTNKGFEEEQDNAKIANEATVASSSIKGNGSDWFWVKDVLFDAVYDNGKNSLRVFDDEMYKAITNVTDSNRVRVMISSDHTISTIVQNNSNNPIPVNITNAGAIFPTSGIKISNSSDIKVSISEDTLKSAIEKALGMVTDDGNPRQSDQKTLADFLNQALSTTGLSVSTSPGSSALNVVINGLSGSVSRGLPVSVND